MTKNSFLFILFISFLSFAQNIAPTLTATGEQIYCPLTSIPIVTSMSIIDPDDDSIQAMYIQISSGYVFGEDTLTLTGSHPNIISNWNAIQGKLTLTGISGEPTYPQYIAAIEAVVFTSTNPNPTGTRVFSITIGSANYLESTGHYYEFIPNLGISWIDAKNTAATLTYFGLQGYLATITSMDEVQISSLQSTGAGWIGGTDEETEGVWKWATGSEAGTIFWNGGINGTSPNFAFWNNGEPNNQGDEDYAHVTAPGIGIPGSWNDLKMTGENSGAYQPKGFVVEYGGMPGDPVLNISTTTTLSMLQVNLINGQRCGSGEVSLEVLTNANKINWFTQPTGGTPIFSGNAFTTPVINNTTTYYIETSPSCNTSNRLEIVATIIDPPSYTNIQISPVCENATGEIIITTNANTVRWYANETDTTPIGFGNPFTTPILTQTTTFYFELETNGCLSDRFSVEVLVSNIAEVEDQTLIICENASVQLQAGLNGFNYLWSTGETSQQLTVSEAGVYSVLISNNLGCSTSQIFTVIPTPTPQIDQVIVDFEKVVITTLNTGNFLYSIDGINYFPSNVFYLTNGGRFNAYVKDINDCFY